MSKQKCIWFKTFRDNEKDKHKIIISGKWHRVCLSPSLKIQQEEIDFFLEKFVNENL